MLDRFLDFHIINFKRFCDLFECLCFMTLFSGCPFIHNFLALLLLIDVVILVLFVVLAVTKISARRCCLFFYFWYPPSKKLKIFPGLMRSYPVRRTIAVSEIIRYKQTNILLLYYKDIDTTQLP